MAGNVFYTQFAMKKTKNKKPAEVPIDPVLEPMNSPVPDRNAKRQVSPTEADLFKQAENPLGDPEKPSV